MNNKIRLGMIGGGPGGSIGEIHRFAARLDDEYELVCGAFSSSAEKSRLMGEALRLNSSRVYANYEELIAKELKLPVSERVEVLSIVTPNHLHFPAAKLALENNIHVICEKPATCTLAEAKTLRDIIAKTKNLFCTMYTKAGYPMVKEAQAIIASGKLGKLRKVYVEYPQGWLATQPEKQLNKQALWRNDPKQSGKAGTVADVGTHAFQLAEYITGLQVQEISAHLAIHMPDRNLDDDCSMLLKFSNHVSGILYATQIAVGEEPNLNIKVYGEKGGLKWQHIRPNELQLLWVDKPLEILRAGIDNQHFSERTLKNGRTPAGQFEGHIEAFANHYRNFALAIRCKNANKPLPAHVDYPSIEDGVRGMAFIEAVLASHASVNKWTAIAD